MDQAGGFFWHYNSDQFVSPEKISDFECSGVRSVRTGLAVVSEAGAEVATDRSRCGFRGIGSAHGLTPLGNRAFGFERQHNYLSGTHELSQLTKEPTFAVHRVEALSLFARESHRFDCHDLKSSFVNA